MSDDRNVIRFATDAAPVVVAPAAEDADLLEYARVLWKHRKRLAALVLGVMVVTAVINLCKADVYRSTATLLPVSNDSGPAIPSALRRAFGVSGAFRGFKRNDPADRFVAILKSETVAEGIVTELDLMPVLFASEWDTAAKGWSDPVEPPDIRDALRKLREQVLKVDTSAEGVVEVAAQWTDPALAARIANQAVTELQRFLRVKDLSLHARHRKFLEERLLERHGELAAAEEKLKQFQSKHGLISVTAQTRAIFDAIATVQARIQIDQSRIDAMREFRGPNDSELLLLELQVKSLKNRLLELERGLPETPGVQVQTNGFVPMYKLPEVGLLYARLLRDVTVLNEVFTLLSGELERAKIEERREQIAVSVLDTAREPDRKHGPRRTQNTLLAGVVAAFLGVLLAFGAEGVNKLKTRAAAEAAHADGEPPAQS